MEFVNIEIEQAILGLLIINDKYYDLISEEVKNEYFCELIHKDIFDLLVNEMITNKSINPITIKDKLNLISRKYDIDNYLPTLLNSGSGIVDIKNYCLELKNLYAKRELSNIIAVCKGSLEEPKNASEILENIKQKLDKLEDESSNYLYEVKHISEILAQRVFEVEQDLKNGKQSNSLKTGLFDFDRAFNGIPRSQLTIIGGRSSMGKSTFALQLALNIAKEKNVLFFSEEMGLRELADKIIANNNNINSIRIRDSNLQQKELDTIKINCQKNSKDKLFIIEKQGIDSNYIKKTLKRFERKVGKVDLIIVDHLQMTNDSRRNKSRVEELGNITLDFKEIAKNKDCGFILLSQLSRGVEGRESPRPELIDLRESGRIEENSDLIMFVYRKDYYISRQMQGMNKNDNKYRDLEQKLKLEENKSYIMVKKCRSGKIGDIVLKFVPEYSQFVDLKGYDYNY